MKLFQEYGEIRKMVQDNPKYREVISDCSDKVHFARQFISADSSKLDEYVNGIAIELEDVASDIRTVCLDVKMFDNFRDMMKQLLIITFQDGKFSVEDTMVSKEDFIDENSEAEICYQITCLLEDFSMNGIYMLLMIKNYDEVKEKWTPSNFGWIRGVMCDNQNLSIMLFSEKSAEEISKEPLGSSPFYNIIEVTRV